MGAYKIKGLTFLYPESDKKALNDLNIEIKNGDFIVICGRSGSG